MDGKHYVFTFQDSVPMVGVEETLLMAVVAAEGIHGRARVRLDAKYTTNAEDRTCAVSAQNDVGQSVAKIFTELLVLEIGEGAFEVSDGDSVQRCAQASNRGEQ